MGVWIVIIIVAAVIIAIAVGKRPALTEQDKRRLMNRVEKRNLEAFCLRYPDLRRIDYEGAFAIHNSSRHLWYFGTSGQVYYDVMEILRGRNGPNEIHQAIQAREFISIRTISLRDSGLSDLQALQHAMESTYTKRN